MHGFEIDSATYVVWVKGLKDPKRQIKIGYFMIMERELLILQCPPPTSFCVLSTPCTSCHICCPPTSLSLQVTVPSELTALMSGERLVSEQHPTKAGKMVFRFRQEIPIPSYLVALVVGALESR